MTEKRADLEDLQEAQEEEQEQADAVGETEMTPMTTRPHQMPDNSEEETKYEPHGGHPSSGNESDGPVGEPEDEDEEGDGESGEDESEEDDMPDFMTESALVPIVCHACSRTFAVNHVKTSMRCICGSDDLDLDERESKTAMDVDPPDAEIPAPGGAVGDPPITQVDEFQPELGELPDNQQFAEPFTEDGESDPVESKMMAMARDIFNSQEVTAKQALLIAQRVITEYPLIGVT